MQAVRGLTFSSSKTSAALRYSKTPKVTSSSILWSGRSFAASVASHSPEESIKPASHSPEESIKPYKRVSRDERKKSIIDFVDKYRALNAGKFPSVSAARKEVGGSYYIAKNVIQELQYKSKHAPTIETKIDETLLEDERISLKETPDVPSAENGADLTRSTRILEREKESDTLAIDNNDANQATSSSSEVKEETLRSSIFFSEATLNHQQIGEPSSFDKTHSDQIKLERKEVTVLCKDEVGNIKNASSSDGSMDLNEIKVLQENGEEPSSKPDITQGDPSNLDERHSDPTQLERPDLCNDEAKNIKDASSSDSSMDLNEPKVLQKNDEGPSESDKMQGDLSNVDKTHSDQLNLKRMEVSHPPNDEAETNRAASSDGPLDLNQPKVMQENGQEASEPDKLERPELPRHTSRKENEGRESAYKSSVWGSLRSFADGIINLWKKK